MPIEPSTLVADLEDRVQHGAAAVEIDQCSSQYAASPDLGSKRRIFSRYSGTQ